MLRGHLPARFLSIIVNNVIKGVKTQLSSLYSSELTDPRRTMPNLYRISESDQLRFDQHEEHPLVELRRAILRRSSEKGHSAIVVYRNVAVSKFAAGLVRIFRLLAF